jgi:hypothetical protein
MIQGLDRMPPRTRAWLCVAINQLAFPGLGTILMRRRSGYVQATVMVAGFILATGFALWVIVCAVRYTMNPAWDEADFRAACQPFKWALFSGLALCAMAWVWALFSSIGILRRMSKEAASPGSSVADRRSSNPP